jgi:CheY-like chemotaxis protein
VRLDFNVLWVEDQPDRVAAQIRGIAKKMEDEGFEFKETMCQSIEAVKRAIASDVFNDEVDLILVDWDLGEGAEGQHAIAEVREAIQYKDVVFYSAQTTPSLEGIYCVAREELVDEVVGVFESLVKKVLDLDHARGIVMGATSDIDYMVNECLLTMHGQLNDDGKKAMLQDAVMRTDARLKDLAKRATKLRDTSDITDFFAEHMLFTAYDRLRILSHALDSDAFKAHGAAKPSVGAYMEKVVPERNILGHQVLVPAGKPQAVADHKGKLVSLEEVRTLRRLILTLRHEFRRLLTALRGE